VKRRAVQRTTNGAREAQRALPCPDRIASYVSPEATIPTKADVIANPASPHEARAGCLPYADPHVLQVCRSSRKRRNQTESTAPDDVENLPVLTLLRRRRDGTREKEERERKAGEDGRACWRRSNLDRYIPGRGCERHRLNWLGGLATPSRRYTGPQKRGRSNKGNSDPFLPR
jgi:hypothetical protein